MLDLISSTATDPSSVAAGYVCLPLPRTLSREATLSWTLHTLHDASGAFDQPEGTGEASPAAPAELDALEARFEHLVGLPSNWDSYGGQPINRQWAERALRLARVLLVAGIPTPSVVPTPNGGIQLEWHRRDLDLELAIESDFAMEFYCQHRGVEEEGVVGQDLGPILRFLDELRLAAPAA